MEKWNKYWAFAGERSIKTFAQTAVALISGSQVLNIIDVDWANIAGVSALAMVMSLLTSVLTYNTEK